jgi:predicted DNA-binding transcriptional regulator YafY
MLRFDYADRKAETSQRRVEPYRIVNAGQRWYLVAWDLDRSDWRTFRVDRMQEGMSPGPRFTPRPLSDAEAQEMVARGIPPEARAHQARVTVAAPASELMGRFGPWLGTIEPIDETTSVVTMGAERLDELAVWIGFLGADFHVSEPPELVEQLRLLAGRFAGATT